jgi:hypothetical protein
MITLKKANQNKTMKLNSQILNDKIEKKQKKNLLANPD